MIPQSWPACKPGLKILRLVKIKANVWRGGSQVSRRGDFEKITIDIIQKGLSKRGELNTRTAAREKHPHTPCFGTLRRFIEKGGATKAIANDPLIDGRRGINPKKLRPTIR